MDLSNLVTRSSEPQDLLPELEKAWGEPVVYRTTGRILSAQGLGTVPLQSWGLVALTPTRLLFRHFPQPHPLFGGKDSDVQWEVPRQVFSTCEARIPSFWAKLFSATPEHLFLAGQGVTLNLELTDSPTSFYRAWNPTVAT